MIISRKVAGLWSGHNDQVLIDGWTDGRTNTQKVVEYNIIPHHTLWWDRNVVKGKEKDKAK